MVELSPPPAPVRGVIFNIQALRAVAALMVVFVHLDELGVAAGARHGVFEAGNAGVDLFFVISGLIMVLTTFGRPSTPAGFMINRLKRIAPLYWLITVVTFAIAMLAPQLMQATRADPIQLLKSLLFIPFAKANGLTQPVAFVGWTLNYEMAFYAVFALSLLIRNAWVRLSASTVVIASAAVYGVVARPDGVMAAFYTAAMIVEFAIGMWVARWFIQSSPPSRRGATVAVLAIVLGFVAMAAAPVVWPGAERALVYGIPAAVIVVCALIAERRGLCARSRWIQAIGDASYSIYLTHFFVTQAATKVHQILGGGQLLALALLPVTPLGVVAVGVLTHRLIERPLARWISPKPRAATTNR